MAYVIWDLKSVILLDYLEQDKSVKSHYYYTHLHCLGEEIKETRPGMLRIQVLFHQDNARVYTSVQSMVKTHYCGF